MSFLEFYSNNFASFTIVIFFLITLILIGIYFIFRKILKNDKRLKTPWFEIAPDSVMNVETEEMGKTRLLLKRQMEYVDNYIKGCQPLFLNLTKLIMIDAMKYLFQTDAPPKTHMMSCLIQSETNALLEKLTSYVNNLLIMNHIGTNKEKIESYAKSHVSQLAGITKQFYCECYNKLSGDICMNISKYWKKLNINPTEWTYEHLVELLIGVSELRYSDFNNEDEKN